jgi:hypothetical protein
VLVLKIIFKNKKIILIFFQIKHFFKNNRKCTFNFFEMKSNLKKN